MEDPEKLKSATLRFCLWNTKSVNKRINDIPLLLKEIDILVCVESQLTPKKNISFPGFLTFRKDREHAGGGGIVILIRRNIGYVEITNIDSPHHLVDMCGLRITDTNPILEIIVYYRTPGLNLTQVQWDKIIGNVKKNSHCIIVGDFNSHNRLWNSEKNDTNGNRFLESLEKHDLFIHSDNTKTYIDLKTGKKSNLDLIISTMNIADKISVDKVSDELYRSDHYPIFFSAVLEKSYYFKKSFRLDSVRTNWTSFNMELDKYYVKFLNENYDVLPACEKYDQFLKIISDSIIASTPKKQKHLRKIRNPAPWWNAECDKIKRLRSAAYKKWNFSNNLEDLIAYKKMVALAIKTFNKEKKEHFKNFAESINFHYNMSYV